MLSSLILSFAMSTTPVAVDNINTLISEEIGTVVVCSHHQK